MNEERAYRRAQTEMVKLTDPPADAAHEYHVEGDMADITACCGNDPANRRTHAPINAIPNAEVGMQARP